VAGVSSSRPRAFGRRGLEDETPATLAWSLSTEHLALSSSLPLSAAISGEAGDPNPSM
jgi:hypothetical protein